MLIGCDRHRLGWFTALALLGWMAGAACLLSEGAIAQITPDETLGDERSIVNPGVQVRGGVGDRIDGGATRGAHLFHSFQEFNVGEGQRVYFGNPDDIANIFSRVTGGNPSNILGTLGVDGAANLFFLNPNGILFGPNASLDVSGSFVATTANGIQFGEQGFFSATNPETPSQLLTVNPSAFFFNQIPASITNSSRNRNSGRDPSNSFNPFGLRVPDGKALLLLGGDININGGGLVAFGGRIELGSVGGTGTVNVNFDGGRFSLDFSNDIPRADVTLTNEAGLIVAADGSGEIGVTARNIDILQGSSLTAGILPRLGSETAQAGDITINATGTVAVANSNSRIVNNVFSNGMGIGGNIFVSTDSMEVINTQREGAAPYVETDVNPGAVGRAGNLTIETRRLLVDSAQISASLNGRGEAGSLTVRASDSVELRGEIPGGNNGFPGGLFVILNPNAEGIGGTLTIETEYLRISDGSKAQAISFGRGNSGDVNISADEVEVFETAQPNYYTTGIFVGAGLDPRNTELTRGGQGNLAIRADRVSVRGGEISAATRGEGDAGRIFIQASDLVEVIDTTPETGVRSLIYAPVLLGATGQGGSITIETDRLVVQSSRISASTDGQGDAGDLTIRARSITLTGVVPGTGNLLETPGGLLARVRPNASGRGGTLRIATERLNISDGSQIQVATSGNGSAGQLFIRADEINISETNRSDNFTAGIYAGVELAPQSETSTRRSGGDVTIRTDELNIHGGEIAAAVDPGVTGQGGDINIQARLLSLTQGANITASTSGQGNAGDVTIRGAETITLDRSSISTAVNSNAIGQGGDIDIRTGLLQLNNRSQVSSSTLGRGNTGEIIVRATDGITLNHRSQITSSVGRNAIGNSQRITLHPSDLLLNNRSQISAATAGQGNAGDIFVQDAQRVDLNSGSSISTAVNENAVGQGGTIEIATEVLNLDDRSEISARSQGREVAGDITITASEQFTATDSDVITASSRSSGGDIRITSSDIRLLGDSDIRTNSGVDGGNITLSADTILAFEDSDILAFAERQGGDITLDTEAFFGDGYQETSNSDQNPEGLDGNDRVDINASGQVSSGTITTPDTSFIQNSLTELPDAGIDTDNLVANSCVVRSQDQIGTFVIAGAEGLPQRPGDAPFPTYPTGAVRSTEESSGEPTWQMGDPIVEPQGLYLLEDGRMVLSRECLEES